MITIREAGPDDATGLATLRAMWVLEQEPALQEDPDFKDTYRGWMDANPRKFFVARQDGALIGMLNLMIFERMPKPGKVQCWSLRRAPDAAHSPGATVVV